MLEGHSLRSYGEAIRKHKASHKFHHDRFLSYSDRMTDGFCARFSSGLVLLDAGIDLTLQRFLATVAALLETETLPDQKVRIISAAIADACGGKYGGAPERLHERMVAAGFELSDLLPIGVLLGDKNSGVGLCHHRALLLKYILDSLEVCPSVLVDASIVVQDCLDDPPCSSEGTDHMWNITRLDQPMFCDIMQAPPVLQQAEDLDRCIVSFMEPKCVLDICFGTVVEVLSQSTGSWMAGRVTIPWSTNRITVEFVFAGMLCMKHVRPNSRSWRKLSQDAASDSDVEHDPCGIRYDSKGVPSPSWRERVLARYSPSDIRCLQEREIARKQRIAQKEREWRCVRIRQQPQRGVARDDVHRGYGHGGFGQEGRVLSPQGQGTLDTLLKSHGYSYLRKLGQGTIGTAILVNARGPGKRVIKMIDVGAGKLERENALKESDVLRRIRLHPYIVTWHECFQCDRYVCIVMEYCEGGELHSRMFEKDDKSYFGEIQIKTWLAQGISALKFLHDLHVLHRDIKPANFLLAAGDTLKMGDFGLAKILSGSMDHAQSHCGTQAYMSPELLQNQPYSQANDIWAMGVTLHEMCFRRRLFSKTDQQKILLASKEGIPLILKHYSKNLRTLCSKMLSRNPRKRPTASDILQSPAMRDVEHIHRAATEAKAMDSQRATIQLLRAKAV
eukprot:gnl/TRDRNA2_/TRDRNA2_175961_c0_seq7.p1 gnl/TRDRNA2_/TRDRNA2_175961_c0~~gnl/TRDRNA2_/TRDRNA2_175961_c0_seq7.p1  ORF type:complete len:674 (+),score=79.81 gnl/TRDRNA2_/TRDRNA2_175961_c0_seq7:97-2118(+)